MVTYKIKGSTIIIPIQPGVGNNNNNKKKKCLADEWLLGM